MAIPRRSVFAIGLAFRVNEETVLFAHEIDRAPDSSGVPGTFARILTLEPGVTALRDLLPQGLEYWYRHRCVGDDFVSSAYSTPVGPVGAETGERPRPDLGSEPYKRDDPFSDGSYAAKGASNGDLTGDIDGDVEIQGGTLYVADTETILVGTVATPTTFTRTLHVGHAELVPESESESWTFKTGQVEPGAVNTIASWYASIVLPIGVTISTFRARFRRETTSDVATAAIYETSNIGTGSLLVLLTHDTTGWQTKTGSLSQVVAADKIYTVKVTLKGVAAVLDARFVFVDIDYDRGDYQDVI